MCLWLLPEEIEFNSVNEKASQHSERLFYQTGYLLLRKALKHCFLTNFH